MLLMLIGRFRRTAGPALHSLPAGASREPPAPPSGVTFFGSWVDAGLGRCFQVVDCEDLLALQRWAARWRHRVEMEVVPIVPAHDAIAALQPVLD